MRVGLMGGAFIIGSLFLAFAFTSCATTSPQAVPAPPDSAWTYDGLVKAHITPAMLAVPLGDLCPNSDRGVDIKAFWANLLKATAFEESGWNTGTKYQESFADTAGKFQISQGLFQLSLDDSKRKGPGCKALNMATILQGPPNALCAIEIVDQLITANTKKTLRENLGRYWSTIRDGKMNGLMATYMPLCYKLAVDMEMSDP